MSLLNPQIVTLATSQETLRRAVDEQILIRHRGTGTVHLAYPTLSGNDTAAACTMMCQTTAAWNTLDRTPDAEPDTICRACAIEHIYGVFEHGYCHALALALHEQTGWPTVGLVDQHGEVCHYLVRHPSGNLVDARGTRPERDVLAEWGGGLTVAPRDPAGARDMENPQDVWQLAQLVATQASADGPVSAAEQYMPVVDTSTPETLRVTLEWAAAAARRDAERMEGHARVLRHLAAGLTDKPGMREQARNLEREAMALDETAEGRRGMAVGFEEQANEIGQG